jgi:hypothetical protein
MKSRAAFNEGGGNNYMYNFNGDGIISMAAKSKRDSGNIGVCHQQYSLFINIFIVLVKLVTAQKLSNGFEINEFSMWLYQ